KQTLLLILTSSAALGLEHFPKNYLTVKQNANITCGTEDTLVTWTLNDQALDDGSFGGNIHVNGPFVIVDEVDTPVLGEYICWSAGQKMSSTVLLYEIEEEDENLESLRCRAKSYDCFLPAHGITAAMNGNEPCHWVDGREGGNGRFQFELSHSLSPYVEETRMLELTVEAIDKYHILNKTKRFYLRDIIQPDSPSVVTRRVVGQMLNVTIEPPPTWSSPHSFFSLENEIEYILKDDGQVKKSSSSLIPRKISKFRVRCRDSYVLSAWSPWTPWHNVM
uniref:IL-12B n=1 Tax=Neogobius melanostomus TaxID=47308 RepID=A0A8C6SDA8_9GOBI